MNKNDNSEECLFSISGEFWPKRAEIDLAHKPRVGAAIAAATSSCGSRPDLQRHMLNLNTGGPPR
jgi:hypothetical protein